MADKHTILSWTVNINIRFRLIPMNGVPFEYSHTRKYTHILLFIIAAYVLQTWHDITFN